MSLLFWMTRETKLEGCLRSSLLILNMDFDFLKASEKRILKLFSTTCLVLCQTPPPEDENRMNLP